MVSKDQQETADYEPLDESLDESLVVWYSDRRTEEGREAQALVMKSQQGYHAYLSYAYKEDCDTPLGPAYPTKEEAIEAAKNELTAWFDRNDHVMSHREWYERCLAEISAGPAKIDRDDDVEPER